jgi:ABC-type lipoprotein release transport system permease subunit
VITYLKPDNFWYDKRGEGRCEQPIPVVLNPLVMELFNLVLDSTLQKAQLGTLKTLLGFEGEALYGHSFYREVQKGVQPRQKLLKVVGFSRKALEAGVTMPMEYVRRANAAFGGGQAANDSFDSLILKIGRRENLPDTLDSLAEKRVQLARRSSEAEKLRTILLAAMALFLIMSGLILGIAAVNITHTFLMVIFERKREIGVLRSIGASRAQVRALFLGESVFVGVLGGVLGNVLAVAASLGVDRAATAYLGRLPMKPDSFFLFEPRWLAASVGAAVFFSLLGAFFPANRAAGMDPARILSQP